MSGKVEYLERYSVAPPPSRDYYGIKILRDEVIIYLWKISHGPHRVPAVRKTKFSDFDQDKELQDVISRTFGEHLLNYVKNIAAGDNKNLLTLPRDVIQKIASYLSVNDVIKLSSLSRIANVIFNDNCIWEILYKKQEKCKIREEEKVYSMAYGWKQLLKDKQDHFGFNNQKAFPAMDKFHSAKVKTTRPVSGPVKSTSRSCNSLSKGETPKGKSVLSEYTKLPKDVKANKSDSATKLIHEKKSANAKPAQPRATKSAKREKLDVSKNESRHELRTVNCDLGAASESKASKVTANAKNSRTELSKSTNKTTVERGKSTNAKVNAVAKGNNNSTKKNSDAGVSNIQQGRNKHQTKSKPKGKSKVTQSKSTILTTDKALLENTTVHSDSNFDLAFLIEESLKKIRSPRTVFDYDFSYLEGSKTSSGDTKFGEDARKSGEIVKSTTRSQHKATLDRLSEKSESLNEHLNDIEATKDTSTREHSRFANITKRQSDLKTAKSVASPNRSEICEGLSDDSYEKSFKEDFKLPDKTTNRPIPRGSLNSIDIMKSLRLGGSMTKATMKHLPTAGVNRFAIRKSLEDFQKDRMKRSN